MKEKQHSIPAREIEAKSFQRVVEGLMVMKRKDYNTEEASKQRKGKANHNLTEITNTKHKIKKQKTNNEGLEERDKINK